MDTMINQNDTHVCMSYLYIMDDAINSAFPGIKAVLSVPYATFVCSANFEIPQGNYVNFYMGIPKSTCLDTKVGTRSKYCEGSRIMEVLACRFNLLFTLLKQEI